MDWSKLLYRCIHGSQMVYRNDFSDPQTSRTISRLTFVVLSEKSPQLLDGLPRNLVQTFMVPPGWIVKILVIP